MQAFDPSRPPIDVSDSQEMADWAEREYQQVGNSLLTVHDLSIDGSPPSHPEEGMIRYADGSAWNPGVGGGPYVYRGSAWWPMWPWEAEYNAPQAVGHAGYTNMSVPLNFPLSGTWAEVSPSYVLNSSSKNTRLSPANRLQIWYDQGDLQANATYLAGSATVFGSVSLLNNNDQILLTFAKNGVAIGAPVVIGIVAAQQTTGNPAPFALTIPVSDLVHGDALSLAAQGTGVAEFYSLNLSMGVAKDILAWYQDVRDGIITPAGHVAQPRRLQRF